MLKTAGLLLAAIATWTAVTVATAPAEAAPQPVVTVAYVDPNATLDPSRVEDWRGMDHIIGIGGEVTYAADSVVFRLTDGVYSVAAVQAQLDQRDGDA